MQAFDRMPPQARELAVAPVSSNTGGKYTGKPGIQKSTVESMTCQKIIPTTSG